MTGKINIFEDLDRVATGAFVGLCQTIEPFRNVGIQPYGVFECSNGSFCLS